MGVSRGMCEIEISHMGKRKSWSGVQEYSINNVFYDITEKNVKILP